MTLLPASLLFLSACSGDSRVGDGSPSGKKVLVLGIDGFDPKLLQRFMDEGHMPHFQELIRQGDFKPLGTTMPPLSPVAWSTFITGMNPGGHGIFDFIHRDPRTLQPLFSMSKVSPSESNLSIGSWNLPLSAGKIEQLRQGEAFWEILERAGIPTTVFRIPVNFPPASAGKTLSGMGTPDLLGTPGTFTFYTNDLFGVKMDPSGGRIVQVQVDEGTIRAELEGPPNPFRLSPADGGSDEPVHPEMKAGFTVYLDPAEAVARFEVQGQEFILKQGEWSDWIPIRFQAFPLLVDVSATVRFYLQAVRPKFRLYTTPLQIDPRIPAMPISQPEDWSHQLCEELGYFYTQELPEDTSAFSEGIFDGEEFWQQAQSVFQERRRAFDHLLEDFQEGLLFFYFSSVDQGTHMLWRYMDPQHPGYVHHDKLQHGVRTLYQQMDEVLGRLLKAVDQRTTLIVMSDHGFSPFYWGVNLNTWLLEKGYIALKEPSRQGKFPLFMNVDWGRTRAYALGLNGIYVNLFGRERDGIVLPGSDREELLDRLEADLLDMKDTRNGQSAVSLVVRTDKEFQGPQLAQGPDLIVGYQWGYRSSWKSPLGEFPKEVFVDNQNAWSGDHSIDYRLVPGVLISNRRITLSEPALYDLTVALLDEFGVQKKPEMIGEDCLQ